MNPQFPKRRHQPLRDEDYAHIEDRLRGIAGRIGDIQERDHAMRDLFGFVQRTKQRYLKGDKHV